MLMIITIYIEYFLHLPFPNHYSADAVDAINSSPRRVRPAPPIARIDGPTPYSRPIPSSISLYLNFSDHLVPLPFTACISRSRGIRHRAAEVCAINPTSHFFFVYLISR